MRTKCFHLFYSAQKMLSGNSGLWGYLDRRAEPISLMGSSSRWRKSRPTLSYRVVSGKACGSYCHSAMRTKLWGKGRWSPRQQNDQYCLNHWTESCHAQHLYMLSYLVTHEHLNQLHQSHTGWGNILPSSTNKSSPRGYFFRIERLSLYLSFNPPDGSASPHILICYINLILIMFLTCQTHKWYPIGQALDYFPHYPI